MKTICVDARLLGFSGIGSYLKNILPLLKEATPYRWIYLVTKNAPTQFPFLQQSDIIETDISLFSLKELLFFDRIVPSSSLFWSPHFNSSLRKPNVKKILLTYHDPYHQMFYDSLKPHEKLYTKYLLPRFLRRANACITVSQFSKREITRLNPFLSERLISIYNGIDHALFSNTVTDAVALSKYHLSRPYFLSVGTLKKHKNFLRLIEAFNNCLGKCSSDLVICGTNEGLLNSISVRDLFDTYPALKNRVHFVRHVPDKELSILYQNARAFIFPSYYEGFGFPPLEAMAAGCPTITSSAASLPEVCEEATYYIDPFSTVSLERAMLELEKNDTLRETLKRKGLQQAQRFTWQQSAQEHLRIIDSLLYA